MLVIVKCFPEIVYRFVSRFGARINKDTYLGLKSQLALVHEGWCLTYLKHRTDGIEEPTMGVDLLLILCLQDKDNLYRDEVVRILAMRQDKLGGRIH